MGTDFSRVRLNPLLDYAGVELKQGGLLLDADANEMADILDRRLRALASDVLGRATVSATTLDAFKISVSGSSLSIGKGRLYVDGLLAENHGARSDDPTQRMFDDLMAEPQFTNPIDYAAQPYLPNPPALPTAGRHLVYLDVWDREVTYLEQPDLVEIAVGVDASSRVQTVWQVRVMADDAGSGSTCATPDADMAGWADIITPSSGVLTTGTFEVAPVDDACELPPTGGYRGLENQLYRVEIHDPGQPGGGATFKWSRENASVGSPVASMISGSELELVSLGRDDILAFKTNDWVEIIDDRREFSQAPGEIRQITVTAATKRISFTPPLPAEMLPGSFPDSTFPDQRNLRVRRWEQAGKIFRTDPSGTPVQVQDLDVPGSTGLIGVPGAGVTLLLEDGVTVSFDVTGPEGFHSGDYWVFAARTADASVELLDRAPPRGIHHYARLGIWDVGAGTVTDCRHPWPPSGGGEDCCCTACVTAESHASGSFTIQDAVNQAAQTGGTVCIGPGEFVLAEPVRMVGIRSVLVRGQGAATVLAASGSAFLIQSSLAVGVENLAILSLARQPAVSVQTAIGLSLGKLLIAVVQATDFHASAIALQGVVAAARIEQNAIFARTGIVANDPSAPGGGTTDETAFLITAGVVIDDNVLWCAGQAVVFDGLVGHLLDTRVTGNDVIACSDPAVTALGLGFAGSSFVVAGNTLGVSGTGIRCGVDGAWIGENKLVNATAANTGIGISLLAGLDKNGSDQCQVLANQIQGFGAAAIVIAAPVRDLIIKLNIIENCGNGILPADTASTGSLSIENNHLRNIEMTGQAALPLLVGIGAIRAQSATIAGNILRGIGLQSPQATLRAGILTVGVQRARIGGNEITELAPPGDFVGRAAGIMALAPIADAEVSRNRVDRDQVPSTQTSNGQWQALVMIDSLTQPGVTTAGNFSAVRTDASNTVVLGAGHAYLDTFAFAPVGDRPAGPSGSVLGNVFNARGDAPAAEIALTQCLFSDNRVDARLNRRFAVTIAAPVVIVDSNRITGEELSLQITEATSESAAVLGNITTRGIALSGGGLSAPWAALNLQF